MPLSSIGKASAQTGVSTHALRYYEKIGLLPTIRKNKAGQREYGDQELALIQFIKRAQMMQFSLAEIKVLIRLQKNSATNKPEVRTLVVDKLNQLETRLQELRTLKTELSDLLASCERSSEQEACPILQGLQK